MSNHYHYLFKFVIAGDTGVGKSTMIQQFTEETHENKYVPTQRIHFASKIITVNDLQVKCQLWDMGHTAQAGRQEGFTGLADSLCKKAASILLVFDSTNLATFDNLERWIQDIKQKCDENVSITLVANKVDKEQRTVSKQQAQQLAKKFNIKYFQVSSYEHKSIAQLFEQVVKTILERLSTKNQSLDNSVLKSKIKRGKMDIQPHSPGHSTESAEERQKQWKQPQKTEDSEELFTVIDKLTETLKKTCFIEDIVKRVKTNIKQKGIFYLRQIKEELQGSRMAQSSTIIKDLFEIFAMIEESSFEQHRTISRVSLENEELIKYKDIQPQLAQDKEKIQQLEKKIEVLTVQKAKLQLYKENSDFREHNLLQLIDKYKRQKKAEVQKNDHLLDEITKLQSKLNSLSKELNRYKEEQEELNVQKLIEARENCQIIQQLEHLQQSGANASLLGKLRKKFSENASMSISHHGSHSGEPVDIASII